MAYRNMKKIIEHTNVNYRYSMNATELVELCIQFLKAPADAIYNAFTYGYALGAKAERAKIKNSVKRK